jgi:3-dehydrotetronate 4-kinase
MTNQQVAAYNTNAPHFALDIDDCLNSDNYSKQVFDWVVSHLDAPLAPIVYATADVNALQATHKKYGAQVASQAVEQLFAELAIKLKEYGVRNFIVAGGETSGVVTQSLQLDGFHIGPQISPGVPWVKAINSDICLALKSGNFGTVAFFSQAQEYFK